MRRSAHRRTTRGARVTPVRPRCYGTKLRPDPLASGRKNTSAPGLSQKLTFTHAGARRLKTHAAPQI